MVPHQRFRHRREALSQPIIWPAFSGLARAGHAFVSEPETKCIRPELGRRFRLYVFARPVGREECVLAHLATRTCGRSPIEVGDQGRVRTGCRAAPTRCSGMPDDVGILQCQSPATPNSAEARVCPSRRVSFVGQRGPRSPRQVLDPHDRDGVAPGAHRRHPLPSSWTSRTEAGLGRAVARMSGSGSRPAPHVEASRSSGDCSSSSRGAASSSASGRRAQAVLATLPNRLCKM